MIIIDNRGITSLTDVIQRRQVIKIFNAKEYRIMFCITYNLNRTTSDVFSGSTYIIVI